MMKQSLSLWWRFKWAGVVTLLLEWLILLPVFWLILSFGNKQVATDLAIAPIGSPEFIAIFVGAMAAENGLGYAMLALILLLPIWLLTKLALSAATVANMQAGHWRFSAWLSAGGQHIGRTIGLFLRWLIVPIILCGVAAALTKVVSDDLKTPMYVLLALMWLVSLSWFYLALNMVVQQQGKSLWTGGKMLVKNWLSVLLIVLVFVVLAAAVKLSSWQFFQYTSAAESSVMIAAIIAFLVALFARLTVLFWQAAHVELVKTYQQKQTVKIEPIKTAEPFTVTAEQESV